MKPGEETTPICKYCRAQLATEGVFCDDYSLEVVFDIMEGDVIAAYQEGIITTKECLFILGSTTTPLTESRRRKLLSNHQEDRWLRITLVALYYILGRSALV